MAKRPKDRRGRDVMVTDVDALRTLDVADFDSADDLQSALLASTWLPLATRGTTTFRGGRASLRTLLASASSLVLDQTCLY